MAYDLKESYTATGGNNADLANPDWRVAQTFTALSSYSIAAIKIGLSIAGGVDPGNVTISIRDTDGDGKPTGADKATLTFDGSTLTSVPDTTVRPFDTTYGLTVGTKYAILLKKTTPIGSGALRYFKKTTVGGYAGGQWVLSTDEGVTWGSPSDFIDMAFSTYSESLSPATLDTPADVTTDYYLNSDWLAEFTWTHDLENGFEGETHTIWFGPTGEDMVEQTDRSRYSILSNLWYCGTTLEYNTEYQWKVITVDGEDEAESETFTFTTITFLPPYASGDDDGGEFGGEGGKNLMRTVRRLLVAAANKIYYEDE